AVIRATGIDFGGYKDGLVNGGEDRKALAYEELLAPMIKAIQELASRNDALVASVEAKAARIAALEARLGN
ncbi:MAG: hypothetical protein ACKOWF_03925, partial [Chloroflexota bacterium]